VPILPENLARLEEADEPIFALPAVVVHQPNLLKTDLNHEDLSEEISTIKHQKINYTQTRNPFLRSIKVIGNINNTKGHHRLVRTSNSQNVRNNSKIQNNKRDIGHKDYEGEVGLVLAVRSLVQLVVTPLVAKCSANLGYTRPLIIGCCILLGSTTG